MASVSAMPPTPQPSSSFAHIAPHASPTGVNSQPGAMPSFNHPYSMSFESPQQHFSHSQPAQSYSHSFPNGPVSNPNYTRSFGDGVGPRNGPPDSAQIYTAVYSGVTVYEMEVHNVACMRRRNDGWLNATQILKVAGIDKGKRTKVLEKEILSGEHEKVQGGYGKYQGTWISYKRGREFCRQYGVEDILRPLLEHDVTADGSSGQSQDTPTKEQAMAANRKRLYNNASESRLGPASASNGTFFSNISPSTSVALAAMNKAARLNSPAPRPGAVRRQSAQDVLTGGSQHSMLSDSFTDRGDSGYGTQGNGEPARKKFRTDGQEGMGPPAIPLDASMRSGTPTEPNDSFLYDGMTDMVVGSDEGCALPPLPAPETEEQSEKMNLILDLFADSGRVDYATHKALTHLSGEDLNMPLDASANSALHWAATLAKIPLLRLLIHKGANIKRGNAAGQSPLISAVLVSNCWEHSCFPDVLELLSPLIELRDLQGRTILHHIAVSSGIKGRAPSSKYYLEALLEFLVRIGNNGKDSTKSVSAAADAASSQISQQSQGESSQESRGPLTLLRFLSHVVNARDKAGNTALNLVARIGNRSIIQQLIEIGADATLQNFKGVSAKDFGVSMDPAQAGGLPEDSQQTVTNSQDTTVDERATGADSSANVVEELSEDVISSLTSMLSQSMNTHKEVLKERTAQIDRLNQQIQQFSTEQRAELEQLQELKQRVKTREERRAKIANLQRVIQERRNMRQAQPASSGKIHALEATLIKHRELLEDDSGSQAQREFLQNKLPSTAELRAHVQAYTQHNAQLQSRADELKSQSVKLEAMYRRVVSLCTGVAEDRIEESLPSLVAAVESEQGAMGEQRLRDFLRRVDSTGVVVP